MLRNIFSKISNLFARKEAARFAAIFVGLLATLWFIIRVLPKPSRASYPCQRAAFPIASAFVIWISGTLFSRVIYKKARFASATGKYGRALFFSFLALLLFTGSVFIVQIKETVSAAWDFRTISKQGKILFVREMAARTDNIIDPEATVAIVRSDRENAVSITFEEIDTMIREAVSMAGGFDDLIHEGDVVVVKPNVIAGRAQNASYSDHFPEEANGIATDYRIIQVVVNMVREKNASGKIIMIEGSGYGLTRNNINALGYDNIEGLDSIICLDENIEDWYNTSSPNIVQVSLPEGQNLYSTTNKYYLHKIYYNANVVISLPCLKSHFLTGITGGVKNVGIGATPVEIYGNGTSVAEDDLPGRWNHIQHGDFLTQTIPLDKWIHDFYLCRPVDYVIMDGLQGADYGPYPDGRTLSSVQKNLRVILAARDALAIDAIEALIAGFDPYLIGHLVLLADDGAGCINPAFIKVRGTQVHAIKTSFNENMPGRQCKYSDFKKPIDVSISSCTVSNNQINLSLEINEEIAKVEVAYEDSILNPIIIGDYTSITLPFEIENGDANKVTVFIYDKYLNCAIRTLENNTLVNVRRAKSFKLYPNPAATTIHFELPDCDQTARNLFVFSSDGRLVVFKRLNDSDEHLLDISDFNTGMYVIKITSTSQNYLARFNKI
jgi:uncharacterized protein (DUF362 family)